MTIEGSKSEEDIEFEAQVERLRSLRPGLSTMAYKSALRNTRSFDEALDWAKGMLDTII